MLGLVKTRPGGKRERIKFTRKIGKYINSTSFVWPVVEKFSIVPDEDLFLEEPISGIHGELLFRVSFLLLQYPVIQRI